MGRGLKLKLIACHMVSMEPLKCKMSYLVSDSCGGMFFSLFLPGVKLLHALEDSAIVFNNL